MNNYHYIIAGLPELVPDFEVQEFSYPDMQSAIVSQLSAKDARLVEWLEFGLESHNMSHHFYSAAKRSKNNFILEFFKFEQLLRNTQVQFLAKQTGKKGEDYFIGEYSTEFEEYNKILSVFRTENIIERERLIDRLRWEKISEIVTFEYFSINVILAFLAKAKIIERWNRLDREEGAKLFRELVSEVRGTFKGIKI